MTPLHHFHVDPLTLQQARHLLDTLHGHDWEAVFTLGLATGMRRGELLGLKWQDIDVEAQTVHIQRQPRSLPVSDHDMFRETTPKTSASDRHIPVAAFAMTVLTDHQIRHRDTRQQAGDVWHEHDFVFCTETGMPLRPDKVIYAWKKLLHQADLPALRFHGLRSTTASLLLSLGVSVRVVGAILGYTARDACEVISPPDLSEMQWQAMHLLHDALTRHA
jgi:integrase